MNLKSKNVEFWGKVHEITPVQIDKKFGDGKQCVYLAPINTRPNYYVIYIDSSIDISDGLIMDNYLNDGVFGQIEENYGVGSGDGDPFPALDLDCGFAWGKHEDQKQPKKETLGKTD